MRFSRRQGHVKIKLSDSAAEKLLSENEYLSKKDIGAFLGSFIQEKDSFKKEINEFLVKKYQVQEITSILETTEKKVIPFKEIMSSLKISKRVFYPRLNLIKKYLLSNQNYGWIVKRGKFTRVD